MATRRAKQFIFGFFYLAFIGVIGYGIFAWLIQPAPSCSDGRQNGKEKGIDCGGPCLSCEIKHLQSISVSSAFLFNIDDRATTVFFELRNPNVHYGADRFSYAIDLFDATGATTTSLERASFIYPGEIKILMEPGLEILPSRVARASFRLGEIFWKSGNVFVAPAVGIRQVEVRVDTIRHRATVTGIAVNEGPALLRRLVVNAIIVDSVGVRLGASRTVLNDVRVDEPRIFQVEVPGIPVSSLNPDHVKIFLEAEKK